MSEVIMKFNGFSREGREPVLEYKSDLVRCIDCRYLGDKKDDGLWTCGRMEGCVKTIPEGFCGWAVPKDIEPTMEEFMRGQNPGSPEDGSL